MSPEIDAIDHLVLTVADIDQTVEFYTNILDMRVEVFHPADGSVRRALCFGKQKINLHTAGNEFAPKAQHPTPGSADLCFLSKTPLRDWITHLNGNSVKVEQGPINRTGATGPLLSIYIRDPDSNLIEISNQL